MDPHSLYFTQYPKYEPFSCYGQLKILMLCIYVMYELAQLKNFIEQSEFEMAGYLSVAHATSIRIFKEMYVIKICRGRTRTRKVHFFNNK